MTASTKALVLEEIKEDEQEDYFWRNRTPKVPLEEDEPEDSDFDDKPSEFKFEDFYAKNED